MGGRPQTSPSQITTLGFSVCYAQCFAILQGCGAAMACSLRSTRFVAVDPSRQAKPMWAPHAVAHSPHCFAPAVPFRHASCSFVTLQSQLVHRFSARRSPFPRPSGSRIFRWHHGSDDAARGRVVSQVRIGGSRSPRSGNELSTGEATEPYESFGELLRMSTAEALGVFVIFTSAMMTAIANPGDMIASAMASGLGVMVMVFAVGQISGAHFNPAVSFAFFSKEMFFMPGVRKKIVLKFLFFLIAQFVGALLAAGATTWLTGDIKAALTIPTENWFKAFIVELIQGFLLALVATTMSTIHKRPDPVDKLEPDWQTSIFIGGTVMFNILLGGRISGASMNPFRSLAPAIWAKRYDKIWIYLIAPTLGAFWGTWIHSLLKEGTCIFRSTKEEKGGWQPEAKGDRAATNQA